MTRTSCCTRFHGHLSTSEQELLASDGAWGISAIVLWEIEKLYEKRRILHSLDYARWLLRSAG